MPDLSSQGRTPVDARIARLERLRRLGFILDNAIRIPGTRFRIGLDPLLGLIPGGGDTAGMILSAFIVLEAAQMGASKSTLSTMAFNILLETFAGTVPGIGDLFDATWKSNVRNIALLEQNLDLERPQVSTARNRGFAVLLIIGLVIALIGCAYLSFQLLRWMLQALGIV